MLKVQELLRTKGVGRGGESLMSERTSVCKRDSLMNGCVSKNYRQLEKDGKKNKNRSHPASSSSTSKVKGPASTKCSAEKV